jgi:tryptophanyl-tRNA synthetase
MLAELPHLSLADRERLLGHLEGTGKMILVEPGYLLTEASKMPGLDGQKMSKSYNNTITLRESEESVAKKIKSMPTDPARMRRTDPGDPAKCPVWQLHLVYSDDACKEWVQQGCKSAGIGCIECKQPVIAGILKEQAPMRERAQVYLDNPALVKDIVADGCEKAREYARETMRDVRESMGLEYR